MSLWFVYWLKQHNGLQQTNAKVNSIRIEVLRFPRGRGSQIPRKSSREGSKVDCPTHWPPLAPRKYSWNSFLLRLSRPKGHREAGRIKSTKDSNDTIGNWTVTFRLVAQCHTQLRHHVPSQQRSTILIFPSIQSSFESKQLSSLFKIPT